MIVFWVILIILILSGVVLLIGAMLSTRGYQGPVTDHFDGRHFHNLSGIRTQGFKGAFQWMLKRDMGPWTKNYETDLGEKPLDTETDLTITFVNHSSFLIQWNDLNILTDPVWSERCSPFTFAGPIRMRPPGLVFEDLPAIDVVLLSHNHYDHLDIHTVKKLEKNFSPVFIVPLGVRHFLLTNGIQNIIELDWWNETNVGLTVKCMPAQHFSGRGTFDRNKSLWAGYILEHQNRKLYFAGDSGYGEFFKEIGRREGPMDVSIIPIGAYEPRWFMAPIHICPDEAVQVHKDVRSRQSIAAHFGTFALADEGQGKAEEHLILALDRQGVAQKNFIIPKEGEPMRF